MDGMFAFKFIIQPLAALVAVGLTLLRPWMAVPMLLFLWLLPNRITSGSSPLPYPLFTLGVPLLIRWLVSSIVQSQTNRAASVCSIISLGFAILVFASGSWGYEVLGFTVGLETLLGFGFLIAAPLLCENEKHWRWSVLSVGVACLILSLYFQRADLVAVARGAFAGRSSVAGDRNWASLYVGAGAVVWWLIAYLGPIDRGDGTQRTTHRALRILAAVGFLLETSVLIKFRSRGLVLALLAAIAASFFCQRRQFIKKAAMGAVMLCLGFWVLAQTPAYAMLMERFQERSLETGSGRVQLIGMSLNLFWAEPAAWPLGLGINAIYYASSTGPHNVFVKTLVEQGIVGLSLLLCVMGMFFVSGWRRNDTQGNICCTLLVFAGMSAMSIDSDLHTLFWVIIALAGRATVMADAPKHVAVAPVGDSEPWLTDTSPAR